MKRITILYDTREQRVLPFGADVDVERATLAEGDYSAKGVESVARIERKSGADLWGTLHGGHDRFNKELSRLGDYPRTAIVVDDAWDPGNICARMGADPVARGRLYKVCRAIAWTARVPIVWCGTREKAAEYVVWAMTCALEDLGEEQLARAKDIAFRGGPYTSRASLRAAALASHFGVCVECGKRPGTRPKPPGPGICVCGRKAAA